jgi:hypothetical protein
VRQFIADGHTNPKSNGEGAIPFQADFFLAEVFFSCFSLTQQKTETHPSGLQGCVNGPPGVRTKRNRRMFKPQSSFTGHLTHFTACIY